MHELIRNLVAKPNFSIPQRILFEKFQHLFRHVARVKNPGGQVVMRRTTAVQWRLLICQNLGAYSLDIINVIKGQILLLIYHLGEV